MTPTKVAPSSLSTSEIHVGIRNVFCEAHFQENRWIEPLSKAITRADGQVDASQDNNETFKSLRPTLDCPLNPD